MFGYAYISKLHFYIFMVGFICSKRLFLSISKSFIMMVIMICVFDDGDGDGDEDGDDDGDDGRDNGDDEFNGGLLLIHFSADLRTLISSKLLLHVYVAIAFQNIWLLFPNKTLKDAKQLRLAPETVHYI